MGPHRISIALLALGGQGGGVLSDWIQQVAREAGWMAQGTSVPGVAQRTGTTIYYVELVPPSLCVPAPVLALAPTPGDVDIVVAAELMEAGRALVRGLVDEARTSVITSTHRTYAISEKSAMGDGRASSERVSEAVRRRARAVFAFDMEATAQRTGSVISSVMLGALAGSGLLPFAAERYEAVIRRGGLAVEANLAGFAAGLGAVQAGPPGSPDAESMTEPVATTPAGERLELQVRAALPREAHGLALHGVARLVDFQDPAYAELYIDELCRMAALDSPATGWALTRELARALALWMSFEDTIRVADLKSRALRFDRVREEVRPQAGTLMRVTEFMHPRLEEFADTLPAGLGRALLNSRLGMGALKPFFQGGRLIRSTGVRGYLMLRLLGALRPMRRSTLRFRREWSLISAWLDDVREAAGADLNLALELVLCQRLVKGYSDTHARGARNFETIRQEYRRLKANPDQAAAAIRDLREAALADDTGVALETILSTVT